MKKQHLLAYSFVAVLALAIGSITITSAHGPGFWGKNYEPGEKHQIMLESKADILGLSVEELQAKIDAGMTFKEIMDEQGLTQEALHEQMMAAKIESLNQLVADGTITQEQLDQKLAKMQEWQEKKASGEWEPHHGTGGFDKHYWAK